MANFVIGPVAVAGITLCSLHTGFGQTRVRDCTNGINLSQSSPTDIVLYGSLLTTSSVGAHLLLTLGRVCDENVPLLSYRGFRCRTSEVCNFMRRRPISPEPLA